MMRINLDCCIVTALIMSSGCSQQPADNSELEARVADLETRFDNLEGRISDAGIQGRRGQRVRRGRRAHKGHRGRPATRVHPARRATKEARGHRVPSLPLTSIP